MAFIKERQIKSHEDKTGEKNGTKEPITGGELWNWLRVHDDHEPSDLFVLSDTKKEIVFDFKNWHLHENNSCRHTQNQ